MKSVGPPGIEPGLHAPHACVLPVYYGPFLLFCPLSVQHFKKHCKIRGFYPLSDPSFFVKRFA